MENRTREQNNEFREFFQLKQLDSYDLAQLTGSLETKLAFKFTTSI